MGTNDKDLVKLVSPAQPSATAPIEVTFLHWSPDDLPRPVTVEIVEIDNERNDDKFRSSEDLILKFKATMEAAPEDSATLSGITLSEITSPSRGSARVWIKLHGAPKIYEAGIPFSAVVKMAKSERTKRARLRQEETAATEGSFYEVAARVRDGHGPDAKQLSLSKVSPVRQVNMVLLAVEPLSQNDSKMKHLAGQQILEAFHPGNVDAFRPRNWAGVVLRLRDHKTMRLHRSGCSYAILAMLLRYLQVNAPPPAPPGEGVDQVVPEDPTHATTTTLFSKFVEPEEFETKHAKHKPRFIKDVNFKHLPDAMTDVPAAEYEELKKQFTTHFLDIAKSNHKTQKGKAMPPGLRKKLTKELHATFNAKTSGKRGPVIEKLEESGIDSTLLYHPVSHAIGQNDFIPLLVWRINVIQTRELELGDGLGIKRYQAQFHRFTPAGGASDFRTLDAGEHESWAPVFALTDTQSNGKPLKIFLHDAKGEAAESGIVIPVPSGLMGAFGLVATKKKDVVDFDDTELGPEDLLPWQRFVVTTLDRGLPLVGIFSPGQYSTRIKGGHFCLIVGYHFVPDPDDQTKRKVRFIINDPAGGRTHQYEAHDEEELNPAGKTLTESLRTRSPKKLGLGRERKGLNLIVERRKLLSLRRVFVYEPGTKGKSSWNPTTHGRWLFGQAAQSAQE